MDEESRDITTVETQQGPLRHKTLSMGVHNASEIFQHVMQQKVLSRDGKDKLKGARNIADNVIVFGKDREDHDKNLVALCERLKEKGLTASPENCKLGVEELVFFGLKLSKNGVAVNDDKVKALMEAGVPENASEVRSFLGLATYCGNHIPNLATIAAPLWDLTKANACFVWGSKHGDSLEAIKQALVRKALNYFRTDWDTEVTVDASPVGLGAVLAQINPKCPKERNIVKFKSKKLTDIEQRYSQVEKEALAVVWACETLYLYLFGRRFKLITDNRAVELIFRNPNSNPPLRIKRWALRLMSFDYEIVHKPGVSNIADYLSRHPNEDDMKFDGETERHVRFISSHAIPKSMSRDELVEATAKDSELATLKEIVLGTKRWESNEFTKSLKMDYSRVIGELAVTDDGLVMRGDKLVLPVSFRKRAVMIAHQGHQGMTKTKGLLRTKVWFPKMDQMVNEVVLGCLPCQLQDGGCNPQPLKMSIWPDKPWVNLAMDFYGPLPNGNELLVIMDEHSKDPWYEEVRTTAAEYVCPVLEKLFAFVGFPKVLKTDNGPPFNGQKFREFLEVYGIEHRKVTPEHPQANGQVESFMKNVGKVIRNAIVEKKDWRHELNVFAMSYRSTPHSATGVAPTILLFGNNRTNRLPTIKDESNDLDKYVELAKKNDEMAKNKAKVYADHRRKVKDHSFNVGDSVLFQQKKLNKTMTKFENENYMVTAVNGSMISVRSEDGREFTRDASKFKLFVGSDDFDILTDVGSKGAEEESEATSDEPSEVTNELRRSARDRRPVQRYGQ